MTSPGVSDEAMGKFVLAMVVRALKTFSSQQQNAFWRV